MLPKIALDASVAIYAINLIFDCFNSILFLNRTFYNIADFLESAQLLSSFVGTHHKLVHHHKMLLAAQELSRTSGAVANHCKCRLNRIVVCVYALRACIGRKIVKRLSGDINSLRPFGHKKGINCQIL